MRKRSVVVAMVFAGVAAAAPKAKPTLVLGAPTITGKLDAKVVTATVKRSHSKLLACFAKAKVKVVEAVAADASFTIGSDGKITNVAVSIGINPDVETCVAGVVESLQFAKRKGDAVEVTVPLAYEPSVRAVAVTTTRVDNMPSITGTGDLSSALEGSKGMSAGGPQASISIGQPIAQGNLDTAIIRRYVKRNIQRLASCYEKERATKQKLQGTSTAAFVIGADGRVSGSTVSGLDATVDGCLAGVIGAIEFPSPKGGTVSVRCPLTFSPPTPAKP